MRSDGNRPNGCTLIHGPLYYQGSMSHPMVQWDITAGCTAADSYIRASSREPGALAELAAARQEAK